MTANGMDLNGASNNNPEDLVPPGEPDALRDSPRPPKGGKGKGHNNAGKPPLGRDGAEDGSDIEDRKPDHVIRGRGGDDRLVGKKGNNHLMGGDGNDTLIGGRGKDLLVGGKGDDILFGIKGSNAMQGGEGSDTFVLNRGRGLNVVKDFNAAEGDKLALPSGLNFDKLSFTQVGKNTMVRQGDRKIALLLGVTSSSIGSDNFVPFPPLNPPAPLTPPSSLPPSSALPV